MIGSECSPDNYKSLKTRIRSIIKNPEILKFIADHLNTKKMRRNALKKLPFATRFVPDQYRAQKMCDKAILENGRT